MSLERANALPAQTRHVVIEHEGYIAGPRWAFGPGWLRRQVISFNDLIADKGWKRIEVLEEHTDKSLLRAAVSFRLRGEAYAVQAFLDALSATVEEWQL
jgi:hypothetical protein